MLHLILAYQQTKDIKTRNLIVKQYLYIAKQLAGKVVTTTEVDKEDLQQEAIVELIEAIDDYDISKGTKFSTFVYSRIVGRLQQFMRDKSNTIKIPQNLYSLNGKINRARNKLYSSLKREPSSQEIVFELNISMDDYYKAQLTMLAFNSNIVSLDDANVSNLSDNSKKEELEGNNFLSHLYLSRNKRKDWEAIIKNDFTEKSKE